MKHLLLLFATLLVFSACSKDDGPDTPPTPIVKADRTVVVYMASENNLGTQIASEDINEMIAGYRQVTGSANLVIFVDNASKTEKPFIARVTTNQQQPLDTLYKYEQDFYASSPDAMRDVLERAVYYCPANKSYGLVLWGHASGWIIEKDSVATSQRAYGRDTGDNRTGIYGKWMNLPSLRQALQQTGIHWSFIFCDCCNMQCVETSYELRRLTDYLIASPAEITGAGAPYNVIVKDFYIEDLRTMATTLCDDYHAQLDYRNGHLPISVVETTQVQQLADATRKILPDVDNYLRTANHPTQGLIYYWAYDYWQEREKVLYDMVGIVHAALKDQPEKYQEWLKAYQTAVIYSKMSTFWHANCINYNDFTVTADNFGCISMFFPMEKYETASHTYNEDIKKLLWYDAVGWAELGW
jgi:hypothetical protein